MYSDIQLVSYKPFTYLHKLEKHIDYVIPVKCIDNVLILDEEQSYRLDVFILEVQRILLNQLWKHDVYRAINIAFNSRKLKTFKTTSNESIQNVHLKFVGVYFDFDTINDDINLFDLVINFPSNISVPYEHYSLRERRAAKQSYRSYD